MSKFQTGQVWRQRNGGLAEVSMVNTHAKYPVTCEVFMHHDQDTFTGEGKYRGSGDSHYDLVELVTPDCAFDFRAHLARQAEFSERVFGPGKRSKGVIAHIRKELTEVEQAPDDIEEWIDVVILALDGAWRAGHSPDQIIAALVAKHDKNEARTWPDWRLVGEDQAIEHDRSGEVRGPELMFSKEELDRMASPLEYVPPIGCNGALSFHGEVAKYPGDIVADCAASLIELAKDCGQVVTIDLVPKLPLAMGNYDMVYLVREAREVAK